MIQSPTSLQSDPVSLKSHLSEMIKRFAIERRDVTLACGQTSNIYIDCRQVYFRGEAQYLLGELFYLEMLKLEAGLLKFSACGGLAMGSIPLTCALTHAAFKKGRELPGFAVRKEGKDHGMNSLIEGNRCLYKNDRALMLEDVVTTGSSAIKAISLLRQTGMLVDSLICVVDREQEGEKNLLDIGVRLYSLFTLKEFLEFRPCGSQ